MKNGNISGCTLFRPSYDYEIDNKLVISAETTDAAVKLIDDATGECIRFVFIKAGTTYSVRNIPQGRYYVKIAYGEQWSVLIGDPKCKGHFTLNAVYKKGSEILDFFQTPTVNGYNVPSYSLKLSTYFSDPNSNTFSTDHISETDF
ncbi:MAG: hypothetical protein P4L51_04055 [Puia sp.]|nr:hypothetical protein [Puia sp.]